MTQPFISEIRMFSFNFPPRGWATCAGQILPIQQNQALFSLLGTTYGGNGVQTFALPDLRFADQILGTRRADQIADQAAPFARIDQVERTGPPVDGLVLPRMAAGQCLIFQPVALGRVDVRIPAQRQDDGAQGRDAVEQGEDLARDTVE